MEKNRKLLLSVMTLIASLAIGTITVYVFKDQFNDVHNLFDSLYLTVVTYATLGSGIEPQTTFARMIIIFLVIIGVGSFGTILALIIVPFIENKIRRVVIMLDNIEKNTDHCVVCGVNVMSLQIAKALRARSKDILMIAEDNSELSSIQSLNFSYLVGDATSKNILEKSGIVNAKTIIGCLKDDASNILLLMMIQDLLSSQGKKADHLMITVIMQDPDNVDKAKRNGANQVIVPGMLAVDALFKNSIPT